MPPPNHWRGCTEAVQAKKKRNRSALDIAEHFLRSAIVLAAARSVDRKVALTDRHVPASYSSVSDGWIL